MSPCPRSPYATARHIPWNPREIARQAESCAGTAGVGRGPYFGPAAPVGPRYHHYVFELYALSGTLELPADATRAQLLDAMKRKIVGKAAYVRRFRQ